MSLYKIMITGFGVGKDREITSYVVTNAPDRWPHGERKWPSLAEFPVGVGNAQEDQERRAYEYAEYLNSQIPLQPIGKINKES